MKKILYVTLFLLLLVGCSNVSNSSELTKSEAVKDVHFTEIEQFGIVWDEIEFPYNLSESVLEEIKPISTNRIALEIGSNIIAELHKEKRVLDYTLLSITHSTKDNIWCFEYSIDQRNVNADELIDCGGLYIAIDGNKGELIEAWVEE